MNSTMPLGAITWHGRCSRTIAACIVLGWMFSGTPAHASIADYSITPVPSWVVPVSPGKAEDSEDAVGGELHLLVDRQYRDDGAQVVNYRNVVTKVVGQAGLSSNSSLSITFDPGYQALELHAATVTRDGRSSDRLERARVSLARTEDSSEQDLLHGDVTALVVLPDVRVGDTVRVSYSIIGRNPVFGSRHHSQWRVRWSVPVARSSLRVTTPVSQTLQTSDVDGAIQRQSTTAGLRTAHWQWDSLQPYEATAERPDWLPDPHVLSVTAYRNWDEVADWGAELFADHSASGAHFRRLSESMQLVAREEGIDVAIAQAIDYTQQRIRYYGLELGVNSHQPHAPDDVLENGYGDCKDKALLLVTLLDELGVEAWPILVSTELERGITEHLPSPGVFNHVVVLVRHDGQEYWVDATDSRQSGTLGTRGQPEYGAGLVLGRSGRALIERTAPTPEHPTIFQHDRFHQSAFGGPVELVTTTTYRAEDANRFRSHLDRQGRRRIEKRSQAHNESRFGKARRLGKMSIVEDELQNVITVTERFSLDAFWTVDERDRMAQFDVYANTVRRHLRSLPDIDADRRDPIPVAGPLHVAHRLQFHPNLASTERALEETRFELEGFRYSDTEYVLGDSLVFDSELAVSVDHVPVNRVKAYERFVERVMINAQFGRFIRRYDVEDFKLGALTSTAIRELRALHP